MCSAVPVRRLSRGITQFARFIKERVEASTSLIFAFSLPLLIGSAGLGIDTGILIFQKAKLQIVADMTALSAAKEIRLANATASSIAAIVQNDVNASLTVGGVNPPVQVQTTVPADNSSVTVTISKEVPTFLMRYFGTMATTAKASAQAIVLGANPVCLIALSPNSKQGLVLTQSALLNAPSCQIYSNSTDPKGLTVMNSAQITAGAVCSAGGTYASSGMIVPSPQLDCPILADPLANRAAPALSSNCDYTNTIVSGGTVILYPGQYCGGLYLTAGTNVTFNPGVYIIYNGPLMADSGAVLSGQGAGFYLAGKNATLYLDSTTNLNLTAPLSGALAGLLFFQDPTVTVPPPTSPTTPPPPGQKPPVPLPPIPKLASGIPKFQQPVNQILSDNAHNLLGTIYMPQGAVYIDANQPIADQSAYTIIVAREFGLASGPNLVLNSNYAATNVPVPSGLGLTGLSSRLVR